jgi:hypothetical protein
MKSHHTLHHRTLAGLYGLLAVAAAVEAAHPVTAGLYLIAALVTWVFAGEG